MNKPTIFLITFFLTISVNISSAKPLNEVWMEIYSGESKVGYIFRDVSKSGNKTKIEEQTVIKLDLLGTETEMDIRSQYLLKSNRT